MKKHSFTPIALMLAASLMGCSAISKTKMPGIKNMGSAAEPAAKYLKLSDVLFVLKVEIAKALEEIESKKASPKYCKHPLAAPGALEFKSGTGKFSGKTSVVHTDKGSFSALVPFTGYSQITSSGIKRSIIGPGTNTGRESVSTQSTELSFTIDPEITSKPVVATEYYAENVKVSDFLKDALVTSYTQLLDVRRNEFSSGSVKGGGSEAFEPHMVPTSLTLATTFVVERVADIGVNSGSTFVLVPAPGVDQFNGGASTSWTNKNTYELTITLPFTTPASPDSRRLYYSVPAGEGNLIVEEPYNQKRYNDLKKGAPYTPIPVVDVPTQGPFFLSDNTPISFSQMETQLNQIKSKLDDSDVPENTKTDLMVETEQLTELINREKVQQAAQLENVRSQLSSKKAKIEEKQKATKALRPIPLPPGF